MVFDWSNRMIGSEDPEYQITDAEASGEAAMAVYAYADELLGEDGCPPTDDLVSVLLGRRGGGQRSSTSWRSTCSSCC